MGISNDEADSVALSLSHRRQVSGLSVFYCLLSSLASSALSVLCPSEVSAGCMWSTSNPFSVKLQKSMITTHLHSFVPPFCPFRGTNFHNLFNVILSSRSSRPSRFTTISDHPPSKSMIILTLVKPPHPQILLP